MKSMCETKGKESNGMSVKLEIEGEIERWPKITRCEAQYLHCHLQVSVAGNHATSLLRRSNLNR